MLFNPDPERCKILMAKNFSFFKTKHNISIKHDRELIQIITESSSFIKTLDLLFILLTNSSFSFFN